MRPGRLFGKTAPNRTDDMTFAAIHIPSIVDSPYPLLKFLASLKEKFSNAAAM